MLKTTLTAGAIWNHLTLGADAKAFTWSVSGNVGTIDDIGPVDGNAVFTATTPGSGSLTVSAGGKSVTIPISVTQLPLLTVEDFENEQIAFSSGTYLNVFRTNAGQYVQRGHYAGKLDYTLTEDTGWFATASGSGFSNLEKPYTALNLWVYGDAWVNPPFF